jgi:hypothetical protein
VIAPGRPVDVARARHDALAQAAPAVEVVVAELSLPPDRSLAAALARAKGEFVAAWDPAYRYHPGFLAALGPAADAHPGAALADRLEGERGVVVWADLARGRGGGDGGVDARTLVYPAGPERPAPGEADPLRSLFHAVARRGAIAPVAGRGYLVVAPARSRHEPLDPAEFARRRLVAAAALSAYAGAGRTVSLACPGRPALSMVVQFGADDTPQG